MDESTIEQLRLWDRAMFNSDRRFYEKLQDTGAYLDSIAGSEAPTEIYTVEKAGQHTPPRRSHTVILLPVFVQSGIVFSVCGLSKQTRSAPFRTIPE